jgi:hypothetical protein
VGVPTPQPNSYLFPAFPFEETEIVPIFASDFSREGFPYIVQNHYLPINKKMVSFDTPKKNSRLPLTNKIYAFYLLKNESSSIYQKSSRLPFAKH